MSAELARGKETPDRTPPGLSPEHRRRPLRASSNLKCGPGVPQTAASLPECPPVVLNPQSGREEIHKDSFQIRGNMAVID